MHVDVRANGEEYVSWELTAFVKLPTGEWAMEMYEPFSRARTFVTFNEADYVRVLA